MNETAQGPVETAEASEEAVEEELWLNTPHTRSNCDHGFVQQSLLQVDGTPGYKVCPMNES